MPDRSLVLFVTEHCFAVCHWLTLSSFSSSSAWMGWMCKPLPCAPHWQNKPNLWALRPATLSPPTLHTPTHHSGTRGGGAPAKLPCSICLTNSLHGSRLRESGSGVVTRQLYFSCVNMKYAEKNESNNVALPSVQFNVASCLVVLRSHTFFFPLGEPHIKLSEYPHHVSSPTCPWEKHSLDSWPSYCAEYFMSHSSIWPGCEEFTLVSPQGVHLGGREPGDPQCDASGWRQVHLLCRERPGQSQQHGLAAGYRQVQLLNLIKKSLYNLFL